MLFIPFILTSRRLIGDIERSILNNVSNITEKDIYHDIFQIALFFNENNKLKMIIRNIKWTQETEADSIHETILEIDDTQNIIDQLKQVLYEQSSGNIILCIDYVLKTDYTEEQYTFMKHLERNISNINCNILILYQMPLYYTDTFPKIRLRWSNVYIDKNKVINYICMTKYRNKKVLFPLKLDKEIHLAQIKDNKLIYNFKLYKYEGELPDYFYEIIYNFLVAQIEFSSIERVIFFPKNNKSENLPNVVLNYLERIGFTYNEDIDFDGSDVVTCEHIKKYLYQYSLVNFSEQKQCGPMRRMDQRRFKMKLQTNKFNLENNESQLRLNKMFDYIFYGQFEKEEISNNIETIHVLTRYFIESLDLYYNITLSGYIYYAYIITLFPKCLLNLFYKRILGNPKSSIFRIFVQLLYDDGKIDSGIYNSLFCLNYIISPYHMHQVAFDRIEQHLKNTINSYDFKSLIFNQYNDISFYMIRFIYKVLNRIIIEEFNVLKNDKLISTLAQIGEMFSIKKDEDYLQNIVNVIDKLLEKRGAGIGHHIIFIDEIVRYFGNINIGKSNTLSEIQKSFQFREELVQDSLDLLLSYQPVTIPDELGN